MKVLDYERLLFQKGELMPDEKRRLAELDQRDEQIGNSIADWWFLEIVAGWLLLLLVLGLLVFG